MYLVTIGYNYIYIQKKTIRIIQRNYGALLEIFMELINPKYLKLVIAPCVTGTDKA